MALGLPSQIDHLLKLRVAVLLRDLKVGIRFCPVHDVDQTRDVIALECGGVCINIVGACMPYGGVWAAI